LEYKKDNLLDSTNSTSPVAKVAKRLTKIPGVPDGASTTTFDTDDWLYVAVTNTSVQHVILLASRGPSLASLDRAFEAALSSRSSVAIVEELLRFGVDPNGHTAQFMLLVRQKRLDLVEAFLRSPKLLQPLYLNTALAETIGSGNLEVVALLLAYGADPNYQAAESCRAAVRTSNFPMVLLLLAGAQEQVRTLAIYR
jgi:hypothetical protein